jgi:TldD protein
MGYEANAGGTSFLNNPLQQLGTYQVASPLVTVTANRSTPGQLATVQWDSEGVVPEKCTLVHDGILTDFQTTREQAAWLTPYYTKRGQQIRSHGYATAEDAIDIAMQHMPNLALEPSQADVKLDDLIANVKNGVLLTHGSASTDFQARTGILRGEMQEITNGRLGKFLSGGAVLFDTVDLWKNLTALGGPGTVMSLALPAAPFSAAPRAVYRGYGNYGDTKGQPAQSGGYSVQGPAAIISNQPLIDLTRKA